MYNVGVRPSYATGFAQWPGMSEYPELWWGLVAAWDMTLGITGTKVFDWSGNNNTGILVDDTHWVYDNLGSALKFDGSGDYVSVAESDSLKINGPQITVTAWIKPDTTSNQYDYIFRKQTADGLSPYNLYALRFDNSEHIRAEITNASDVRVVDVGVEVIPNTEWTFVGFTYDGSSIRVYHNGILQGSPDAQTENIKDETSDVYIGGSVSGTAYYFDGQISQLLVHKRTLSASEITLLYQLGKRLV